MLEKFVANAELAIPDPRAFADRVLGLDEAADVRKVALPVAVVRSDGDAGGPRQLARF